MAEAERKHVCPQPEKLPVELIAEIIAIVADGAQKCNPQNDENHPFWTLTASSLVSRTWTTICRPHIFHTLSISTENTTARLSFLHFDAPHLSEYIRTVHLWWNDDSCTALAWFPECFARLKNLRALHLENGISSLSMAPAPLSAGIVSMLAAPRLCKLALNGWGFASDASDLLSMLPATLEELKLEDIMETHVTEKAPPTVRFDALRTLELLDVFHPMLEFKSFIDCPNLECLTARYHYEPWNLPPWIPDELSELELYAVPECNIPDFGGAIRPSVLTVNLSGDVSYLELFAWIKNCIDSLPFPGTIQSLTINVTNNHFLDDHSEGLYPTPLEYEELSHFLYKLYEQGGLEGITLSITIDVNSRASDAELYMDEARELAKLETSFAPLVEENVLDMEFLLQRSNNDGMLEPIMRCSIERAEMETE
ncbi:hypothetical protein PTI98_004303 [Pleurotus ostreatus]|nr:hypothetical protein PTI98_004303 [Pleurotus ostreatus]